MKVDMMKADAMKGSGMPGKIGGKGSWALAVQIIAVTASLNLLIAAPRISGFGALVGGECDVRVALAAVGR